jgi:hypothetical protein
LQEFECEEAEKNPLYESSDAHNESNHVPLLEKLKDCEIIIFLQNERNIKDLKRYLPLSEYGLEI